MLLFSSIHFTFFWSLLLYVQSSKNSLFLFSLHPSHCLSLHSLLEFSLCAYACVPSLLSSSTSSFFLSNWIRVFLDGIYFFVGSLAFDFDSCLFGSLMSMHFDFTKTIIFVSVFVYQFVTTLETNTKERKKNSKFSLCIVALVFFGFDWMKFSRVRVYSLSLSFSFPLC